jgi:hypothetical protein
MDLNGGTYGKIFSLSLSKGKTGTYPLLGEG